MVRPQLRAQQYPMPISQCHCRFLLDCVLRERREELWAGNETRSAHRSDREQPAGVYHPHIVDVMHMHEFARPVGVSCAPWAGLGI